MSKFIEEMKREAEVRVEAYKREKEVLAKSAARMVELDALIVEAETEMKSLASRLPKQENNDAITDKRT